MKKFQLALVTGATSGIGEALCKLLAEEGINLLITGRNVEALNKLSLQLQKHVNVTAFPADLSAQRHIIIEKMRQFRPDLIINNAGFGLYGPALNHSIPDELQILEVNANAVLEITLEAAKQMIEEHRSGVILNVASAAAFQVFPYSAVYASSKSFVVQMSQALDLEIENSGVRVLVSCPGMVNTAFSERASGNKQKENPLGMTPQFAAEEIWWQIQKGKPCHIFDRKTRWSTYLSKLFPTRIIANILRKRIQSRI